MLDNQRKEIDMFTILSSGGAAALVFFVVGFALFAGLGAAMGSVTSRKGHGFAIGFFLTLVFPLIGIIVALCLKDNSGSAFVPHSRGSHGRGRNQPRERYAGVNEAQRCGACHAVINESMAHCPSSGVAIAWPEEPALPPVQIPHNPRYAAPTPRPTPRPKRRMR